MSAEPPVTYVETELRRRRRYLLVPVLVVLALLLLIGLVAAGLGLTAAKRLTRNSTEVYPDIVAHFERGSIGADEGSARAAGPGRWRRAAAARRSAPRSGAS